MSLIEQLVWEVTDIPTPADGDYTNAEFLRLVFKALHLPVRDFSAARILGGEQTNTSVVVAEQVLLKILRTPLPGPHPEVVVGRALAASGSGVSPRFLGALAVKTGGEFCVTHIATEFVPDTQDAFEFFTSAVPDPTWAARSLGQVSAIMHSDLAVSFPASQLSLPGLVERVRGEVADTLRLVSALSKQDWVSDFQALLEDRFAVLQREADLLPAQQIHGDFHLGQVLFASQRPVPWLIIDFEGEPLRPLRERMLPDTVLRDVAGMLRSFAYAAAFLPAEFDRKIWEDTARFSFLSGYFEGGLSPFTQQIIDILEIEKTCYECRYEAKFRPDWLWIPLAGLQRFAKTG